MVVFALASLTGTGVIIFLVTLSVLVVLHELGHFAVARRVGVKVNEFAVGMGPKLLGWTNPKTGTLWSIRALPIGGYCAMQGEDGKSSEAEQQREFREAPAADGGNFQAKTPWQRLAIVVAGPIANFILAYVILLVGAFAFGVASDTFQPVIAQVVHGSPADVAGLRAGDRIVVLDNVPVTNGKMLVDTIHASLGKKLDVVYERNGERNEVFVKAEPCKVPGLEHDGCLGFNPANAFVRVDPAQAFSQSFHEYGDVAYQVVGSLGLLVTHFTKYADQVSGPIGMGQAAVTVLEFGWGPYLRLAALISFALGLFNLLPLPALDGGRGIFIVAELLRGKPVDAEKEAFVHLAGFAALMVLMLVVAFHDIARIASGQGPF